LARPARARRSRRGDLDERKEQSFMRGDISVGDWIGGRFQVFDVHEGGMSLVYVVNDHLGETGRKVVALKTLRNELIRYRVRVSRFAAECRLWTQLGDHPNIVRAYSVEIIEGRPYVVLELVQGGDLSRWIGTPRLDLARALRFSFQFCVGMEHAARQGLQCHRDIKPGNLLITEEGTLKITDFGLARVCEELVAVRPELPDGSIPLAEPAFQRPIIWTDPRDQDVRATDRQVGLCAVGTRPAAGEGSPGAMRSPKEPGPHTRTQPSAPQSAPEAFPIAAREPGKPQFGRTPTTVDKETSEYVSPSETSDPRLTHTGARLGTGAYMAPEQFQDPKSVDSRADVYGFGVVLFEMITGRLPFNGRSLEALHHQHTLHQPGSVVPSIPSRYAKLAKPVDAIVQRCLQKDPANRFRSMAELRHALKQVLGQLPRRR
jgi:serine/threonine protein kinase